MRKTFVGSKMLKGFSFNTKTGITTVHFKPSRSSNNGQRVAKTPRNGKSRFQFDTIAVSTLQEWAQAESAGRFFIENIRPNHKPIATS
jgi:hypothetical protein